MAARKINVGIIGTDGSARSEPESVLSILWWRAYTSLKSTRKAPHGSRRRPRQDGTRITASAHRNDIDAMFVCSTPETTHYPITKDCLLARKHTLLRSDGAELKEADEMTALASRAGSGSRSATRSVSNEVRLCEAVADERDSRPSGHRACSATSLGPSAIRSAAGFGSRRP